jgi:AcrR family transcriptional regulator
MSESRSRGRPRTFDREAVLDAAVDQFLLHGFEGVSIADLTAELGCTAPTLYALFGSKDGLFHEALSRYVAQSFGKVAELLKGEATTYSRLQSWMQATAASVTSSDHPKGCLVLVGGIAVGASGAAAAAAVSAARAAGLAALQAQFEKARATGELPADTDVEGLARFYLSVLQGMAVQAVDGATYEQLEPLITAALAGWPGSPLHRVGSGVGGDEHPARR